MQLEHIQNADVDEDYPAGPEIQQPLPEWSNWRGSESSTLETDVCVWRYAILVVHARNEKKVNRTDHIHLSLPVVGGRVFAAQILLKCRWRCYSADFCNGLSITSTWHQCYRSLVLLTFLLHVTLHQAAVWIQNLSSLLAIPRIPRQYSQCRE